jgi:FkbM family methyltransferase
MFYREEYKVFAALRRGGFNPQTIFDVGSSHGVWSKDISKVWPQSRFFLFEPLIDYRNFYKRSTERVMRKRPNFTLLKTAVGSEDGKVDIYADPDGYSASALLSAPAGAIAEKITTPIARLDTLISAKTVPVPDLMKLDVQGSEMRVLVGTGTFLEQIKCLQLEVWFSRAYGPDNPLFGELLTMLEERGFSLIELGGPDYGPDRRLCSCEGYFIRNELLSVVPRTSLIVRTNEMRYTRWDRFLERFG